jgi:PAS domain S-box-containing protein
MDEEGHLLRWNKHAEAVLGYSADELLRRRATDLVSPEDRATTAAAFAKAAKEGASSAEYTFVTREGRKVPFFGHNFRIRAGDADYICGIQIDISDRKDIEDALAERLRFGTLLSELSAAFVNLPADQVDNEIRHWLVKLVEYLGVERGTLGEFSANGAELRTVHAYAIPGAKLPPPRLDQFSWFASKLWRGEIIALERLPEDLPAEAEQEKEFVRTDGLKSLLSVPLQVGGFVIGSLGFGSFQWGRPWPQDLVSRLQLVGEIIANALMRKRAEQSLRTSEERFRKVFEESPLGMCLVTADLHFTQVNPQLCQMLGYSEGEMTGMHVFEIGQEPEHQLDQEMARGIFGGEKSFSQIERRFVRKDDSIMWGRLTAAAIRDERGKILYGLGMLEDITEHKRAEEELRQHHTELAHASRVAAMGELTASLAHELSQPLAAILSNAEAARRFLTATPPDLAEVGGALQDIVSDDERAREVVSRLRALLQRGDLQREALAVNNVVRDVLPLVRGETELRGVTIKLEMAPELPAVTGDNIQLQQVILNLVMNAVEAMDQVAPAARELTIRTSASHDAVEVAVRDTGLGLAADNLDAIFDAFVSSKPQGLGIGLSVSRSIIEAHGGRLWAERHPECGTTFFFSLPIPSKDSS